MTLGASNARSSTPPQNGARGSKAATMRTNWLSVTGLTLPLALSAWGCSPPDAADTLDPATGRPIIAGMADTGDPAIVELIAIKGNMAAKCTATLISPHI